MKTEFDYLRWIAQQAKPQHNLIVGPGDDCAVWQNNHSPILLTTDILTDGVDFVLAEVAPQTIGSKAMAVNLSDIAAMGGRATSALVGLVLPQAGANCQEQYFSTFELAQKLYLGLSAEAAKVEVAIIGGDTNTWGSGLVISITVIGEAQFPQGPILRSGAKVGDRIFVTGPCGGSILGRHLTPKPRFDAIAELLDFPIHAMIDISDGLAQDLGHILRASGCGGQLIAEQIPIHTDAIRLAKQTGKTALDHALNDGEDFELIFCVDLATSEVIRQWAGYFEIGECVESGYWLQSGSVVTPLHPRGWSHAMS